MEMHAGTTSSLKRAAPTPPEMLQPRHGGGGAAPPQVAPRRIYAAQHQPPVERNGHIIAQSPDTHSDYTPSDTSVHEEQTARMMLERENSGVVVSGLSSRRSSGSERDDTLTLNVMLPSKETVPFQVNKRMPLMDLLIHVASTRHFNPSDYAVYNPNAKYPTALTPNIPVGELNTDAVQIVPKSSPLLHTLSKSKPASTKSSMRSNREEPFEKTFRLQINLPHKQMMVLRVSGKQTYNDVLADICREKGFNPTAYTLRHPNNPQQPLDMYRQLAEDRINEINLVPSFQDTIARHSKRFTPNSGIDMEVPEKQEKKRGFDLFRLCRKKRVVTSQLTAANVPPSGNPLKSSKHISKSISTLAEIAPPVVREPSKPTRSSKRHAPAPPPPGPVPLTTEIPVRTRHHSESSGYDESLVLSNSPERDDHMISPPVQIADDLPDKSIIIAKMPVSARSSTSTPDSGLKSASETVVKVGTQISKKKAPAPPPPPHDEPPKESVTAKDSAVVIDQGRSRSTSQASVHSVPAPALPPMDAATSASIKADAVGVDSRRSSDSSHKTVSDAVSTAVVTAENKLSDGQSLGDDLSTTSFSFEHGRDNGHDFDESSVDGSMDIHNEIHQIAVAEAERDAESHSPHASHLGNWEGMDGKFRSNSLAELRRSYAASTSSEESGSNWAGETTTTMVEVDRDTMSLPVHSPKNDDTSSLEPEKDEPETVVVQAASPMRRLISGNSTPDSGIHSQRASLKERVPDNLDTEVIHSPKPSVYKTETPPTSPKLVVDVPPSTPKPDSVPSSPVSKTPSPDTSKPSSPKPLSPPLIISTAATPTNIPSPSPKPEITVDAVRTDSPPKSVTPKPTPLHLAPTPIPVGDRLSEPPSPSPSVSSVVSNAPTLPESTPPPVPSSKPVMVFPPRSPAHVSISSFKDQQPNRYKEIIAQQSQTPYESAVDLPSTASSESSAAVLLKRDDLLNRKTVDFGRFSTMPSLGQANSAPPLVSNLTRSEVLPSASYIKSEPKNVESDISRALSREELMREMRTVQQWISDINTQMATIQLGGTITPENLVLIADKQRLLQEHMQRQIVLTQQLLEQDEKTTKDSKFKRPPSPTRPVHRSVVPNPALPMPKTVGGVPYSEIVALPRKNPHTPVYSSVMADDMERKGRGAGDEIRESRSRLRDSWVTDTSRRFESPNRSFDAAQSSQDGHTMTTRINISTGTQPTQSDMNPTFSFSTTRAPSASESEARENKHSPSSSVEYSRNFANIPVNRRTSQQFAGMPSVVASVKPTPVQPAVRPPAQNTANRLSYHGATNQRDWKTDTLTSGVRSRAVEDSVETPPVEEPTVKSNRFSYHEGGAPRKNTGPLRAVNTPEQSTIGSTSTLNTEYKEDPIDSIVRSWKSGTPTPYHHVNVSPSRAGTLRKDPVVVRDENKVPLPPPAPPLPPKLPEMTRSVSMPIKKSSENISAAKSQQDMKSELMDEIKNFSVNSLRKVPASTQKSWVPKIR
ncbi:mucin-2-like isoform X2 [Paramacrobiotus metropolitanus]|nr:mucin-2-like isoform X2 [Paramacrobiotus metropolitanus]XP_055338466.1 mucin-2-like isoform X2 [Paramacrobiotus metropolitanus]XP_055338467.1 mucin-2-like isoform X2 [Paramacrobiotus metropolitanus]XP_055338468.1 mucin-2-like isoform X2 [Paramacrobiotus metropolitanus]XP_055338469.1 mucin-2-like isoform X2 [Paramacrobiotus metropolitanus]